MLLIVRARGRAVYIGRDLQVTVCDVTGEGDARTTELLVHHPQNIAVSRPGTTYAEHVEAQYRAERGPNTGETRRTAFECGRGGGVLIGRGVSVVVSGFENSGDVRLGIEAPRHMAVSRDDFTFEEHLGFQMRRESGR